MDNLDQQKLGVRPYTPTVGWVLGWSAVFWAVSYGLLHACRYIPDVEISWEHYTGFYYRGDDIYNTNVLSLGNLTYYWLMNILGHIYVCSVNINMVTSPFRTPHNTERDFYMTIALTPIFYFFCACIQLRAVNDLNMSPCLEDGPPICEGQPYPWQVCFHYNQHIWFPAYLLGLQYTHADAGIFTQWSFNPDSIATWGVALWSLTIFCVVLILTIGYFTFKIYITTGIWIYYSFLLGSIVLFLVVVTKIKSARGNIFHFHHYNIGQVAMVLIGYQNMGYTILHGLMNGMMIEGAGRWGYDPLWYRSSSAVGEILQTAADSMTILRTEDLEIVFV